MASRRNNDDGMAAGATRRAARRQVASRELRKRSHAATKGVVTTCGVPVRATSCGMKRARFRARPARRAAKEACSRFGMGSYLAAEEGSSPEPRGVTTISPRSRQGMCHRSSRSCSRGRLSSVAPLQLPTTGAGAAARGPRACSLAASGGHCARERRPRVLRPRASGRIRGNGSGGRGGTTTTRRRRLDSDNVAPGRRNRRIIADDDDDDDM